MENNDFNFDRDLHEQDTQPVEPVNSTPTEPSAPKTTPDSNGCTYSRSYVGQDGSSTYRYNDSPNSARNSWQQNDQNQGGYTQSGYNRNTYGYQNPNGQTGQSNPTSYSDWYSQHRQNQAQSGQTQSGQGWQQTSWQNPNSAYGGAQQQNPYSYSAGKQQESSSAAQTSKEKKSRLKKNSGSGRRMVALGLCCALVGGVVGGGGVLLGSRLLGGYDGDGGQMANQTTAIVESNRTAIVDTAYVDTTGQEMTPSQIYEANVNSCVGINVNITYNIYGFQTTTAASGSGFIITSDGYIVTNYHVVEGGDTDGITVTMYDGTTYSATLVGYEESNDVAVLKIDATGLVPVVLADSDTLQVGDEVVAIGNPLGELTFSLTKGVVSALDREVTLSVGTMNLIQTDCAINSGNSGGPLFNSYGEVVGITNAKYSSSSSTSEASVDNIGFAIPTSTFQTIVTSIIENGYVVRPYLGVGLRTVDSAMAEAYNMTAGAYVANVEEDSPAAKAGLQVGDTIIACDGETVTSQEQVTIYRNKHEVGDTMELTIVRDGETLTLQVLLDQEAPQPTQEPTQQQSSVQQYPSYPEEFYYSNPFGNFFNF